MARKRTYKILLSDEDKKILNATIHNKKTCKMTIRRCQILLELDENGTPLSNEKLESSIQNVFLAGDIALKNGGSIAAGLNHGYEIACEIKKRL